MGIMSDKDKNEVKSQFEKLEKDVHILFFTTKENCMFCSEIAGLLTEVSDLSDKIILEQFDAEEKPELVEKFGLDKFPAFTITDKDYTNTGVRFFGIPSGYEFMSLLDGIIVESNQSAMDLSDNTLQAIKNLDKKVHLQIFVTPTCPYCVKAVILGHKLAKISENIVADMVEATEFPELSDKYKVMGVPRIIINEDSYFEGAYPEALFLDKIMRAIGGQKGNLGQ